MSYDIDKILKEVVIPSNLDVTEKSYLVHVFEKASRQAIGTGLVDGGKIVLFNPTPAQINQTGNTLGWLDDDKKRIVIQISNPHIVPFTASYKILRADGTELIPAPNTPTVWTVEYLTSDGLRYSNSFPNGKALDQILMGAAWPLATMKITARGLDYYGEYTFEKIPQGNLSEIIVVRQLSGLNYPEAA